MRLLIESVANETKREGTIERLHPFELFSDGSTNRRAVVAEHPPCERRIEPLEEGPDGDGRRPHCGILRGRKAISKDQQEFRRQPSVLVGLLDEPRHAPRSTLRENAISKGHDVLVGDGRHVRAPEHRDGQVLSSLASFWVEQDPNGIPGNFRVRDLVPVDGGRAPVAAEQIPPAFHVAAGRDLYGMVQRSQERGASHAAEAGRGNWVLERFEGDTQEG